MIPRPMRRFDRAMASIWGSGYGLTSITSSRKRTARRTVRSSSSQSIPRRYWSAGRANRATLIDPRLHASQAESPCSPHGFVASIRARSGVGLARLRFMRSMNTSPGSPVRQAAPTMRAKTSRAASCPTAAPDAGIDEVVVSASSERVHEHVGGRHRDVEVRDTAVELAFDELADVRMIDAQDPHVGPAPHPALLHRFRRTVEHAEKGDRPRGPAPGGAHDVVLGPEAREREPGPARRSGG